MFPILTNWLNKLLGAAPVLGAVRPQRVVIPRNKERNLRDTVTNLSKWGFASLFLILIYSSSFYHEDFSQVISIFSHGTLIAIAFGSIGCLIGFLFGIPRTLQADAPRQPAASGPSARASGGQPEFHQSVNTNLEQISDWLTKILVGVGLTQLQQIPDKLKRLAGYFSGGLHSNAPITLVIVLNSSVLGFFTGYLLTRLFLASAFVEAEKSEQYFAAVDQYSQGLTDAGQYQKAVSELEKAATEIDDTTSVDSVKKIYESLTYNYLYLPAPGGFQRAIEAAQQYSSNFPSAPSAKVWAYLAAAYGQKYKWDRDHNQRPEVLDAIKASALEAVRNSLKLEPQMKQLLRPLWDPNDVTKEHGQEDDLEVFYNDSAFQALLS